MKYFPFIVILFNLLCFAGEEYPEGPSYQIISSEEDKSLDKNKAKFTFRVNANDLFTEKELQFSDNDKELTVKLEEENSFSIISTPGKHKFMIYLNSTFREIITDSISIEPGFHTIIRLNFKSTTVQHMVKKPVIYLYPVEKMEISINIEPNGEMLYTWPKYEGSWIVSADTNGKIMHKNQVYNYLFWEAKSSFTIQDFKSIKNFYVHRDNLENYIESVLDDFGLTSTEKADFITYWLPEMLQSSHTWFDLRFVFNEDCELFAKMGVIPKPENIARIYLVWKGLSVVPDVETDMDVSPVPKVERNGFTVVEWGGVELN